MSYKSPSNARASSLRKNPAQYSTNPINTSYSPYNLPRNHVLDDPTSLPHTRHSRVKTSTHFTRTEIPVTSSLELREKKLEEQFQTLLDRCSKSKEYIHNMQQAVFGDNNGDIRHLSGSKQSLYGRSPTYSNVTPSRRVFGDSEQENRFFPKTEKNTQSFQYSTNDQSNGYEVLENEVVNLKKKILNRLKNKEIESNKLKERLRSATEVSDDEYQQTAENLAENDFSLSKEVKSPKKERNVKVYDEEYGLVKQEKLGGTNAERSLSRLKATLKEKEKVQEEKYVTAKEKCKELKNVLKEYVTKVTDLEEDLKKKETQLMEYEGNLRKWQDKAIREEETAKEFERRNEMLMKSEAEARSLNNEFKLRLSEQSEKIEELEGVLRNIKEKFRQGTGELSEENQSLRVELEAIRQSESVLKEKYENLQRESAKLRMENENNKDMIERIGLQTSEKNEDLKALRNHLEKLRNDKTGLEQKVKEIQQFWEQSTEKIETERLRYEEEIAKLKEEHEKENVVKREKIKTLKQQLREYEKSTQKAAEDKRFADLEVERTVEQKIATEKAATKYKEELKIAKDEIASLREVIAKLTSQSEETYRNLQVEGDKVASSIAENNKLTILLQNSEDKVGLLERDLKRQEEANQSLKTNLKDYYNENADLKICIKKLENQLSNLYAHQDQELTTVEEQVNQFGREIQHLKEENKALKLVQQELQQELEIIDGERAKYKKKYKGLKKVNQALEKEIQDLDLRMKDVATDKALEIEEYRGEIGHQRQLSSKLKVLEEIQGMIKTHRSQNKYP